MSDPWIGPGQRDEEQSKVGVLARELNGEGGEDEVEIAPILEISRTEERGTKPSVRERPFCDRLGDSSLACPSNPVQPVDRGLSEVPGPKFDLVQNSYTCPLETAIAFTMPKLRPLRTAEIVEDSRFGYQGFTSSTGDQKGAAS